jgi:hypothetical protein
VHTHMKMAEWNSPNTVWKAGRSEMGLKEHNKGGELVQSIANFKDDWN